MATIIGFDKWCELKRMDGIGNRVGLPLMDKADGLMYLYTPPVEVHGGRRMDGKPLLCAMFYDPDAGWVEKEIELTDPDLCVYGFEWGKVNVPQLALAEYKGLCVCLALVEPSLPD